MQTQGRMLGHPRWTGVGEVRTQGRMLGHSPSGLAGEYRLLLREALIGVGSRLSTLPASPWLVPGRQCEGRDGHSQLWGIAFADSLPWSLPTHPVVAAVRWRSCKGPQQWGLPLLFRLFPHCGSPLSLSLVHQGFPKVKNLLGNL